MNDIELFIKIPFLFGQYLGFTDLVEIHNEWIINAWLRKDVEAMQSHRGSYKTTSIIIVGAIWYLLFFDPSSTNLIIRKSDSEAQKIGRTIKDLFESKELLYIGKEIYGKTFKSFKTDKWSNSSFTLSIKQKPSPEGSIDCMGIGGSLTGRHYDVIMPDDIITLKDRISKAERESTKDFVRELRNVVNEGGSIFYSGTPWHKDDAWSIIPEPKVYPIGTVPIKGYREHELKSRIEKLKQGTTISLYDANYRLIHTSNEDKIFKDPVYGEWPNKTTIAYLDPAYSGNNTTALSIGSRTGDTAHVRGFMWPGSIEGLYSDIATILNRYHCERLIIEKNADKGLSQTAMKPYFQNTVTKHESENKHIRIIHYVLNNFTRIIFAEDCDNEYMNQLLDYAEKEEPDDVPDSLAGLMRELGFFTYQYHENEMTGI